MELTEINAEDFAEYAYENLDAEVIKQLILGKPELKKAFIESYGDDDERHWCEDCQEFAELKGVEYAAETYWQPRDFRTITGCCGVEL